MTLDTFDYRGYNIFVDQEIEIDDFFNPRKTYEPLGTMVCFHKRYMLGDNHDFDNPQELMEFVEQDDVLALPLFLMDHSGIAMRTKGFGDADPHGWDWGQVGYIYVTMEEVEEEFGNANADLRIIDKAYEVLKAEVEEYSNFISGEVFRIEIHDPEGELIESIDGILGTKMLDIEKEEAQAIVDDVIRKEANELLSEEKYVVRKRCPNCKHLLIEVGVKLYGIQTFPPFSKARESHTPPYEYVTQKMGCSGCNYEWREYYKLTLVGYEGT